MSNKLGTIGIPAKLKNFLVLTVFFIGLSGCGGGSSGDGDTTQSQNQSQNKPPSANAGESQEALESTVVTLDGSASSDSDGSISSYSWEQVSNGSTTLAISNATSAEASVEIPWLANNVEFVFRLTVTDNDEESAQDEVVITGRPTPNVMVSDVSGNTATLNSAAEFSVQLASQPSLNVSIPLSSSDESEGVPEQSELTFTPENWQQAQTVFVRGTNENVQNGEQNYQIVLSATASLDSFYNAIDPEDVTIEGIVLEISEPETLNQFIANIESSLQIQINYTGNNDLSFSLTESPQGMEIDLSTGKISWTPQESDEGQTYTVVVSANDGNKFTTLEFQVSVATPEPVETEVSGDTLSVIDSSTTLNGMTITTQANTLQQSAANLQTTSASTSDLTQLNIEKLDVIEVPEIPTWITPLTDVFVVRTGFEGDLKVRFPISNLPDNVSLSDISLYGYAESLGDEGKSWAPLLIDINFEGTLAAPIIVIDLSGLEGMAFLGYATPQDQTTDNLLEGSSITSPSMRSASSAEAASTESISCELQYFLTVQLDKFICSTADDSDVRITILGFGFLQTRWGGTGKEDLVSWLLNAQGKFSASSLGYNKDILVNIHQMESFGFVRPSENFEVLHITNDDSISSEIIQGTAVHEYFHHAQAHSDTELDDNDLLIRTDDDLGKVLWLIEGTARWFEDELYDSLNSYKYIEKTGKRIAEAGINAEHGDGKKWSYQRFSFFKMLSTYCLGFATDLRIVMNVDLAADPTGLKNMTDNLDGWSCDFGSHLGVDNKSSLKAALSYYSYATMLQNKISLLDFSEENNFIFESPPHQFNQTWLSTISDWLNLTNGDTVHKLNGVSAIPAAGAYSFKVPSISGELPEGKVAELVVESDREVIVSITSEDNAFIGVNTIDNHPHDWFSTTNQTSYIYDTSGTIPELFVTLVNSNLDDTAKVDVYFKIRDELDVSTVITSHATGDQISNRVVSVAGNIPEEARASTSKVAVTANGIVTDTALNSDGSFVADVVITLGDNIIKAQGFSGSTAITNEEVITIQGVESSTTERNALISSKVVLVLRWDTDLTDLDIYSTDKNGGTIWYGNTTEDPGNLDYDDISGYGPEVVSYRSTDNDIYVNGTFDVDVHYYYGLESTNYTLDVILNETESNNRRLFRYESIVPHTQSNSEQDEPSGSGYSRFNDILAISCGSQRVCNVIGVDGSKLVQSGSSSLQSDSVANAASVGLMAKKAMSTSVAPQSVGNYESAYDQCIAEFESSISKPSTINWICNNDGTKIWY